MALRRLIPATLACALTLTSAVPAQASQAARHPTATAAARPALTMVGASTRASQAAQRSQRDTPYCETHKCIALTFDDGPDIYTETLLKVLRKYRAKATFFMIGTRVRKHLKTVAKVAKEGHEIGNHTWDHKYLTELYYDDIYTEIRDAQRIIKKATKKNPVLFRAPGGLTDADVAEATAELGLVQIPGTTSTKDYIKKYRNVTFLTKQALSVAGRNEVVLMHETVKQTVQSLPAVLKTLTKRGYRFVTVSTLLEGQELIPGQVYPEEEEELTDENELSDE